MKKVKKKLKYNIVKQYNIAISKYKKICKTINTGIRKELELPRKNKVKRQNKVYQPTDSKGNKINADNS